MQRGIKNFRKNEIIFLMQLINALEEAEANLEQNYMKKDYENFDKAKKIMLQIQKKISEVIK